MKTSIAGPACVPVKLRLEDLTNPLGIDETKPRFSWQLADARRGARQTACRILVATDARLLREGKADLWDSGRVESSDSAHIAYGGRALRSRQRCFWRVRVWDMHNKPSPYSEPAHWEMGLLKSGDWRAKWIGYESPADQPKPEDTGDIRWIWYPEGDPRREAPRCTRYFRVTFDVRDLDLVATATLSVLADNSYQAFLNGVPVAAGGGWQGFMPDSIRAKLRAGRNVLAISVYNDGGPAGLAALVKLVRDDGTTSRIPTTDSWKVTDKARKTWNQPRFRDTGWAVPKVLGSVGDGPWGTPLQSPPGGAAVTLARTFATAKKVQRARVYVTALGSYRLLINGSRAGTDILTPEWTDYRKRAVYQAYDVTTLLRRGENQVRAMLGDGWYSSGLGWMLQRNCFGPPPNRLLMQMHIEYADGTSQTVVTDRSWRALRSPILRSEIYAGERYDARIESEDTVLGKAAEYPVPEGLELNAQSSPAIQITEEIRPRSIASPAEGVHIFDMGQNMVGWVRLRVRGPAGTQVRLRFSEILQQDGHLYRDNLRRAEDTDTYILKGGGEEVFEPHFTYRGFRYVEVTGYPGKPNRNTLTGCVFHTANPFAGNFECADPMVNKLWQCIRWGLRGNLHSVPTDCPQRDERLGWTGDAQIIWPTACYLMDVAAFTAKWMRDMRDAQSPEGGFPDVAPRVVDLSDGAPAWGDAGIVLPYVAWRNYGDTRIVERNWAAMVRWMNYIGEVNPDYLRLQRRNHDFGDWVPANSETPKDLIATAYWAFDAQLMADMARAIGKQKEAGDYDSLCAEIRDAFVRHFVREDGRIGNGSQTCYVLALHFGLVPEDRRTSAVAHLVEDIRSRDWHLSTGFIGSAYLMPVLTRNGRNDVAVRLLLNRTYPSWGYMIDKGATTIWERWNGDTGDPAMNSYNHYAYGAVGEWLYRELAGVDVVHETSGSRQIVIRPHPDVRLKRVRAEHDTQYGRVVSEWRLAGKQGLSLDVTVPPNISATVFVPASGRDQVTEGGKPVRTGAIEFLRMEDDCAVFSVPAGTYRFVSR